MEELVFSAALDKGKAQNAQIERTEELYISWPWNSPWMPRPRLGCCEWIILRNENYHSLHEHLVIRAELECSLKVREKEETSSRCLLLDSPSLLIPSPTLQACMRQMQHRSPRATKASVFSLDMLGKGNRVTVFVRAHLMQDCTPHRKIILNSDFKFFYSHRVRWLRITP